VTDALVPMNEDDRYSDAPFDDLSTSLVNGLLGDCAV